MKNSISNSRALFDLFLIFFVLLLVICLIPLAGRAAPRQAAPALTVEDLDIQYSCHVRFDTFESGQSAWVTVEAPKAHLNLGYAITVELERSPSSELKAVILRDSKPISKTFQMDGRRTLQMSLSAAGVSMNCLSQRRK